jgi:hypothetical protein
LLLTWFWALGAAGEGFDPLLKSLLTYLALPVFGLYFSLRCNQFLTAWVWTMIAGIIAAPFTLLLFPIGVITLTASLANLRGRKFALG